MVSAAEEDEELQKRGNIALNYFVGCFHVDRNMLDVYRNSHLLIDSMPIRTVGSHFCYDTPQIRPIMMLMQSLIGMDHRVRFRTHYGTFGCYR